MKHLVQRIVFIGVLLLVLLGLSVASAGAYDAGEVTGSDRMIAAPAASGGDMAGLQAIPGRILAADYDVGGEGVAYHDTTPGNIDSNPSSYRDDDVDIGIRDWDSDPLITNTAAGEWLRYTVDVAEAGTYDVEYLLYTTQAGCTLALDVDGVSAHQIAVPEASSWRTAIRVKGVATFPAAGEHVLTLQVSGDMNLNGMTFSKKPSVQPTLAIPGRILAADYDAGGEGVAYHDTTPGNIDSNPSSYRGDDVDIGIRDWDADPLITNTAAGEWLRYTVDVAEAGTYDVEYLLYTTQAGCTLALDVDGASAHQIAVPEASSWRIPIRVKRQVTFPTAGEHKLILRVSGDMNLNGMTFTGEGSVSLDIPGRILAADYDAGGEGIAYHDTTPGNIDSNPSSYRNDDVDIGIRDWDADPLITNTAEGEWLRYTVDVQEAGAYEVEYLVYTTQAGCTLTLDVDGVSAHQIPVQEASSWGTPIRVKGQATFPTAGEHELILRVSGDMNLNGMTFSGGGSASLDADFTASPTSGPAPLTVQFTDTSTGTPTAWTWAFGDGVTSTDQHPVHTYTDPGTYTVSLTVDDAAGSDTEAKADYITVAAPTVSIAWQRCLGGSGSDVASIVQQTSDGGYIVAGSTESTDGDVGGNHGGYDIWVVKLDAGGETAWQRCLGGSGTDAARNAHPTVDGGYIIGGQTNSTDGDVSGNHGKADIWLVKMDSGGNISWQRCIGGSNYEDISNVCQTSDGGYLLTGETDSNDGDVSGYHDRNDTWLVKIDPDGLIEWEKSFGPIMINTCAQQTDDGGYVLCGWCWEGHGMFDGYVLKVDATGVLEWQSYLGGSRRDFVYSILQTGDGGYIAAGSTQSDDLTGYHWNPDVADFYPDGMAIKLDATGAIEWQRCLGGYDSDGFSSVDRTSDGGYILAGYATSNDGDVSGNHGNTDVWMGKLDAGGSIEGQHCMGGSGSDRASSIRQTADGGYIVAGSTESTDGDVSGNHGASDIWVVKLESA